MSVYKDLLLKVDKGSPFKISLLDKNLIVEGKIIIQKGENKTKDSLIEKNDLKEIFGVEDIDIKREPYRVISFLYHTFKHSVTSSRWNERKSYFKALPLEKLTDEELAFNCHRYFAQAMLEGYILLASLQDWLKWEREDHWYWVDETDNDCIVLKRWIE